MIELKKIIHECLNELGVVQAGTWTDGRRWSSGDLATDLAPLLYAKLKLHRGDLSVSANAGENKRNEKVKLAAKREAIAYFLHVASETNGAEVWRALFAEIDGVLREKEENLDKNHP